MPRYYFDVHGLGSSFDEAGEELPDDEAAWGEATQFAAELFKDIGRTSAPGDGWQLVVSDANRNQLYVIHINSEKSEAGLDKAARRSGADTEQVLDAAKGNNLRMSRPSRPNVSGHANRPLPAWVKR
jgi:hypothetical protein